jgi:Uma2 family endonuclease
MASVTQPRLLTAEEFMAADLGEGNFELVRGEIVEMPPAMPEHGRVCANACYVLESYGRQTGLGYALSNDTAVVTERGPDTVRGADVSLPELPGFRCSVSDLFV